MRGVVLFLLSKINVYNSCEALYIYGNSDFVCFIFALYIWNRTVCLRNKLICPTDVLFFISAF